MLTCYQIKNYSCQFTAMKATADNSKDKNQSSNNPTSRIKIHEKDKGQ